MAGFEPFDTAIQSSMAVTATNLFFCSLDGLASAKFRFPGHNKLFGLAILTMMIPTQAILVPLFIIMANLNWINTYQALIVPSAIGAFGIFFMRQYIGPSVPSELLDAARIDGCSESACTRWWSCPSSSPPW